MLVETAGFTKKVCLYKIRGFLKMAIYYEIAVRFVAVSVFVCTHSSVTSLGMPLGKTLSPLLLQRTTVSKHEHSAGQRAKGEQLFSSLPTHHTKRKLIIMLMFSFIRSRE